MGTELLFSVFVFLAAACVLVPISKLSGLGSVIGYLIAGVLIGPHVLGLISEPETILHFAEFGVVMMLFLIGLELQPKALWEMRSRLLGLGGLQVFATAILVAFAAYLIGLGLAESIVVGMALSLSSTAIALQIMQDRSIMGHPEGRSGFAVLLFQDVIVIAMIASLPFLGALAGEGGEIAKDVAHEAVHGASHGESDGHASSVASPQGIWLAVAIFGVFGGMFLAGRLLLRPMFKIIARSNVRETFTAIALLLVIGAALLMNWLGLSAALGAFIAGVVLADSEYRHQLESDIEPFKALLLGLFFISVGMSLDFGILSQYPVQILGVVTGLLLLKFVVLFVIGTFFKLELSPRILFATLLCQAGEFGFVLFQFALTEGAIRPSTAGFLNAVIALSMALTPLLILAYDKLVSPRLRAAAKTGEAPQNEHNPVLILGYGRVGQVVGRLLQTQNIGATIIDSDGDHIEFVKQFGQRVFYGDATDMDLLRIAGADEAKVIVVAMDDRPAVTNAVKSIKHTFPNAKIIARARGRTHLFDLLAEGVDFAERETIRGALAMGENALTMLDFDSVRAARLTRDFLAFDFKLVEETYHMRDDIAALAERSDQHRALLTETLNATQDKADG
ncbi:MAG: monovalent cation:proton antiporter-2 (CPA2) family protein [Litorimonas sp.]